MKREREIKNTADFLIARSQLEIERLREMVNHARSNKDYFEETAAAKLLAFAEEETKIILHYAELKQNHPDLARALEEQKPYLFLLWQDAEEKWEKHRRAQGSTP